MQRSINSQKNRKLRKPQPTIQETELNQSEKLFQIMFVDYDNNRSLEVVESAVIDFSKVIEHISAGNSVFIAPKRNTKPLLKRHPTRINSNFINHV